MTNSLFIEHKVTSVRKFYFIEYFYILLRSVEEFSELDSIFEAFILLKDNRLLGESKYKKLGIDSDQLTSKKLVRYEYTFNETVEEAELYGLIKKSQHRIFLLPKGKELIGKYEQNIQEFNLAIFDLMESRLFGFHYLIQRCYLANKRKDGLLIFPTYSPRKLGIEKDSIRLNIDILNYIDQLTVRLEQDIQEHLQLNMNLEDAKKNLIQKLKSADLLPNDSASKFNLINYNLLIKRTRDYWLTFFLNDIYKIQLSSSYFDIWCYRGKQFGIVNATEFYYNFSGKIVYPISILSSNVDDEDFRNIFNYPDGSSLYVHTPKLENIQEDFSKAVYESYIDIKNRFKTYFINLADLRDIVCFKIKISYEKFEELLQNLYQLNLKNETKIKISLEADKLPYETKAMYLKREPVLIDGRERNIIAIEIKK